MLFTSPRFLVFLAFLLLILAVPAPLNRKKGLLAGASCFFYAAWDWRYLGLLLLVSGIDYVAAFCIHRAEKRTRRRLWLLVSITSNLSILGYFKYCNFFIDNLNLILTPFGVPIPALDILLPAGISFYTFKSMSYTIDVYRGELVPCDSWLNYVTFITFFPELIAGPIVRGSVFLPQLDRVIGPGKVRMVEGVSIFLLGLTKKLLVADQLAIIADTIFAAPATFSSLTIWCGVLAYTLQIYCDFSGYSDMAVGTARMIGYDLPQNFNMPYLSTNIAEFWRRWHITLSTWLRDYLYIPLGGNRLGAAATYRNLILTMLLGGLWHGASWNFVIWGGLHGCALATQRVFKSYFGGQSRVPLWLGWALTTLFIMVTWVPFRAKSLKTTITMLDKMFWFANPSGAAWFPEWLMWCVGLTVFGHVIGVWVQNAVRTGAAGWAFQRAISFFGFRIRTLDCSGSYLIPSHVTVAGTYVAALWLLLVFFFAPLTTNPFIYFQF